MIYLILAIICSTLISVFMRISEGKKKSTMGMFIFNYLVCAVLSFFYSMQNIKTASETGSGFAVTFGIISGMLYLASFMFLQLNISKNGVVLSSIFMKLGVIISILIAIIAFKDLPNVTQIIGIVTALSAIIVINYEKNTEASGGNKLFLIILLLIAGITDSTANIYDKIGNPVYSDNYLLYIFIAASVCSIILYFIRREKLCKWDVFFGFIIGIPNYYSSRFLLAALNKVSAVVVYPVYSVATIILISLSGLLIFKEKISVKKAIGLIMVVIALIFLNI